MPMVRKLIPKLREFTMKGTPCNCTRIFVTINIICFTFVVLHVLVLQSISKQKQSDVICYHANMPMTMRKRITYNTGPRTISFPWLSSTDGQGSVGPQTIRKTDPHNYSYLITASGVCDSKTMPLLLIVGVCSEPDHFQQRLAIRQSWGQVTQERNNVKIIFLLGRSKSHSATQDKIFKESAQFADIAQEDFLDTYYNLTLKSVMLLKWASHYCPNAEFVLKTDDDMFIHLPNLLNYLDLPTVRHVPRQLFGHLNVRARPNRSRSSKRWKLVKSYKSEFFPRYVSGGAYVMSADTARVLYQTALKIPLFRVEDVFITGMCATRAAIRPKDHPSFLVTKNSSACSFTNIVSSHGFEASELRRLWAVIKATKC